jgi:alkylhydroperoxidase/carboxymuconolactone decarboxylase family protein YurZ
VVHLRYFEERILKEMAQMLDLPLETIRTRLRRAREKLRAALDHEAGGDRMAWCLALAPVAGLTPAELSAGLLGASLSQSTTLALGVLKMSLRTKHLIAIAVLLLTGVSFKLVGEFQTNAPLELPPQPALALQENAQVKVASPGNTNRT